MSQTSHSLNCLNPTLVPGCNIIAHFVPSSEEEWIRGEKSSRAEYLYTCSVYSFYYTF